MALPVVGDSAEVDAEGTIGFVAVNEVAVESAFVEVDLYAAFSAGVRLCQCSLNFSFIPIIFRVGKVCFLDSLKTRQNTRIPEYY